MRSRMIVLVVGLATATLQPTFIPPLICISITLLIIAVLYFKSNKYTWLIGTFLLGFLYTNLWGYAQLQNRLGDDLLRSDWLVSGEVVDIVQQAGDITHFMLQVENIHLLNSQQQPKTLPQKLRLSWYRASFEIKSGDLIKAKVRLKPPHGLLNPEGFDYERWLLVRGIDATGYVRTMNHIGTTSGLNLAAFRHSINQHIYAQQTQRRVQAFLTALITGEKHLLQTQDWSLLRTSGTVHLAVISGLHIGFAALVGWCLGRLFGLLLRGRLQRALPYLGALLLSGFYMLIAGAELPVQRAYIMISVLLLSGWKLFYISPWSRWWLAMVAVLIYSPLAAWDTGFWLSFSAVACLIWCGQAYRLGWQEAIKLQFLLLAAMLPLYLVFFSGFSVAAPLVNILAIPLVSLIVPLEFLNLLSAGLLAPVLEGLVLVFWWLVEGASSTSLAYAQVHGFSLAKLILLALASLILLLPKGMIPKAFAIFLLLPLLFGVKIESTEQFRARVFDVGQGLAVLIELQDYTLLYDTGPAYRSGGSAFERAILPYLERNGIDYIDRVVVSHDDNDHAGGFKDLSQHVSIGELTTSFDTETLKQEIAQQKCLRGQRWSVEGVRFEFLSGTTAVDDNDRSCVLLVQSASCRLLLPGDIGAAVEQGLGVEGPIDWLIAAHHGSNTSTSQTFLETTHPKAIIFSAGYGNAFNHPHPKVLERSKNIGAKLYSTAQQGAILLEDSLDSGCKVSTYREEHKRFWRSFRSL